MRAKTIRTIYDGHGTVLLDEGIEGLIHDYVQGRSGMNAIFSYRGTCHEISTDDLKLIVGEKLKRPREI